MKPLFSLFMTALTLLLSCAVQASNSPPNIVFILADDMGYSDAGCFGGEMATPSINRLASEGLRLTQFQNGGMCVVSRSSLLTSHWWPKMRTQFAKTPLLSEKLSEAGYRTGLIGKWHLRGHPMDRGFDHFFGLMNGATDHFAGNKEFQHDRKAFNDFGSDWYSADVFSDRAISFIRKNSSDESKQPFFLYLSYQTPHSPLQAPKADIMRNRSKYLVGWQAIREARFERQKKIGLFPADATLPDYPQNLPEWDSLTPAQQDLEDLRMATYAAMVERMDQGIGRVTAALEEIGELDNTLIVFMSDNGTDPFHSASERLLAQDKLPGDQHSNWQPGFGWAYASVTPWRLYKISQHAGGITTGAVIRWPGHTGPRGRIDHSSVHMIDLMPTFLEIAGQASTGNGLEGESFLPLLGGESWQRKRPLYFHMADNRAIRNAVWTLAEVDGSGWELFHRETDPFEKNDLAASKPEIVTKLNSSWMNWWRTQSGELDYTAKSSADKRAYQSQGDRGSGEIYRPAAMPKRLANRYPISP